MSRSGFKVSVPHQTLNLFGKDASCVCSIKPIKTTHTWPPVKKNWICWWYVVGLLNEHFATRVESLAFINLCKECGNLIKKIYYCIDYPFEKVFFLSSLELTNLFPFWKKRKQPGIRKCSLVNILSFFPKCNDRAVQWFYRYRIKYFTISEADSGLLKLIVITNVLFIKQ